MQHLNTKEQNCPEPLFCCRASFAGSTVNNAKPNRRTPNHHSDFKRTGHPETKEGETVNNEAATELGLD
jgi:hypothetical protein